MTKEYKCNTCHHFVELRGCTAEFHLVAWETHQRRLKWKEETTIPEVEPEKIQYGTKACSLHNPRWNNLPENCQKVQEQIEFLLKEIPSLKVNLDQSLIFGSTGGKRIFDGVGIRWMNTAGGFQYCLFNVTAFNQESARSYMLDEGELIEEAIKRMAYYVRPLRSERHSGVTASLTFSWSIKLSKPNSIQEELTKAMEDDFEALFGKCETIELKLN